MKNSELAIKQLNTKLREYLILKNININSSDFLRCINPSHPDHNPSMHLYKSETIEDTELLYCFSCQTCCTIFTAAFYIEGLPISGREFFNITIPTLCKYFNIEYEQDELSEDEREAYTRKRAYRDASNIICNLPENDDNPIIKRIIDRGYCRKTATDNFIGGVTSFDDYVSNMTKLGWDTSYLEKIDLFNHSLFNANNLLFTIRNEYGEPVGFVARRIPWNKSSGLSKFENSSNSDIYKKGHILYNLDKAKRIKKGPLWIVEGYPDTITMLQNGIDKVAGIGGIAFTDDHSELLNRLEIYDLIVCLDGDTEGIKATENTLEKLSKYKCFNVKVVDIPLNMDPDDFIKSNGIDEFKKLPILTPFEWMLKHSNTTGEELVNKTIPIILEEKNYVTQMEMCKTLTRLSGIELGLIRKEIDRRQNWAENIYQDKINSLKDRCVWRLQKEKSGLRTIINEILRDHEKIDKAHTNIVEEDNKYNDRFKNLKERYLSNPELLGYKLNSFPMLQKCLDGIPKNQSLIAFAGKPNVGKSSFLRHVAYDLVNSNPELLVLYMTIDDNYEKTITPFIAIDQDLEIEQVKKPNQFVDPFSDDDELITKFDNGWDNLQKLQKDQLIIRDVTSGNDLDSLERHINKIMNEHPDKKMLVVLDNFHKLGGNNLNGRREEIINKSERIKEISNVYDIPILMTVELRKMGHTGRPILEDITESNQIEYDCDVILLLHNELHNNKYTHLVWDYNGMNMPFLEVDIAKNKETSSKRLLSYKFITTKSKFEETDGKAFNELMQKTASIDHIIQSAKAYEPSEKVKKSISKEKTPQSFIRDRHIKNMAKSGCTDYLKSAWKKVEDDPDVSKEDIEYLMGAYRAHEARLSKINK